MPAISFGGVLNPRTFDQNAFCKNDNVIADALLVEPAIGVLAARLGERRSPAPGSFFC